MCFAQIDDIVAPIEEPSEGYFYIARFRKRKNRHTRIALRQFLRLRLGQNRVLEERAGRALDRKIRKYIRAYLKHRLSYARKIQARIGKALCKILI